MQVGFLTVRMLLGYGVDLVVGELARRLAQDGHGAVVFTTTFDETYLREGICIEKLEVQGGKNNRALPLYEWNASRAMKRIRAKLADCDVIVPATFPFYGARCAYAGPIVHYDFGNVPTSGFSLRGKANWQYLHLMETYLHTLRADAVVTISQFLAQRFLPEAQHKLHVIHLGGDHYYSAMLQRGEEQNELRRRTRERLGISESEIALGCCTRLHRRHAPYKNLSELIAVWKSLRAQGAPVKLALAGLGSPEDEAWLRAEGADPLLNLPPEEMPAFYSALDIYASPSEWEGFNLPLVEAAWFGVPAVAFNVAAHPETTASLLAHSVEEFHSHLSLLAHDARIRARLGREASQQAQQFTWGETYRAFLEVLQETCKR